MLQYWLQQKCSNATLMLNLSFYTQIIPSVNMEGQLSESWLIEGSLYRILFAVTKKIMMLGLNEL